MKGLITAGITFVVLAVAMMVGAGIVSKTFSVVNSTAPSALLTTANTDLSSAITTFTGFLPVIAIAFIGGLAIFYVMGFVGGSRAE